MKILFIQPTGDKKGHYGAWTTKLCQAIGKNKHEVTLFTNKLAPEKYINEDLAFELIEYRNGKFCFSSFDNCVKSNPLFYWWAYFRNSYIIIYNALKLCRSRKFDVIFITDTEYLVGALLLKLFSSNIPAVVWHIQAANFTFSLYQGSYLMKLYKVIQTLFLKSVIGKEVNGIVTLGEIHKNLLPIQLGLSGNFPIEVVPDGADEIKVPYDKHDSRFRIGVDYSGEIFLFLGMIRKDKGLEYLLESIKKAENSNFKVIIAGVPFDYTVEEINRLVNSLALSGKVILRLGYLDESLMPYYYSASDAVIFPYTKHYTGSSGPLTKGACTYGKPVIASDISEIGRSVRKYNIGLLVLPQDADSLSLGITKFINLPAEEKIMMRENAFSLARLNSWANVANKLVSFLNKTMEINR